MPARALLAAGIVLALAAQAWLIFVQEFNWDEFFYLGLVHDHLRGDLDKAVQTIHVHLFAPLAALPGNEVDQILAGRLAMLGLQAASLVSLYLLARTWAGGTASLLAVFAYVAMPVTIQHGASFRADPLALAPIMAALAMLARAPLHQASALVIGLLVAVAALVTIKVVLFVPAFAGISAWRLNGCSDRRRAWRALATMAASATAIAIALYLLHRSGLSPTLAGSGEIIARAGATTLLDAGLFPRLGDILQLALTAPIQVVLIAAATAALVRASIADRERRWQTLALLGCVAPLASLIVYRNAFPYFFPFIMTPAFAAVAWFVEARGWSRTTSLLAAAAMLATGAIAVPRIANRDQQAQRALIAAVHAIFPRPIAYIDRSSMVASFPKRGFFMSSWGVRDYRRRPPLFEGVLRSEVVPLLIVNAPALEQAVGYPVDLRKALSLHEADKDVLRASYIPHWGRLWVAGKRIDLRTGEAAVPILVPGTYTVEGAPLIIAGLPLRPGQSIALERGTYRASGGPGTIVTLRWGERLHRPSMPPPAGPLFQGF